MVVFESTPDRHVQQQDWARAERGQVVILLRVPESAGLAVLHGGVMCVVGERTSFGRVGDKFIL